MPHWAPGRHPDPKIVLTPPETPPAPEQPRPRAPIRRPSKYTTERWLALHGLTVAIWTAYNPTRCDLCGEPLCTRDDGHRAYGIDHDHAHCPGPSGCLECVRGVLCASCNGAEHAIRRLITTGHLVPLGTFTTYWLDPPFQRWRRAI